MKIGKHEPTCDFGTSVFSLFLLAVLSKLSMTIGKHSRPGFESPCEAP